MPLGAFLSGGLDSSSVVAFMAQAAEGRVKTFSIGFEGGGAYDETAHARAVAQHFGTDHTEFVVEPKALELIDRLVWHHDGPFGDSSAVPTYLLAELTRKHVTVALNGDGGDEVFARLPALLRRRRSRSACPRWAFRRSGRRSGSCPSRRTASIRCASPSASRRRGSGRSLERYLRWNAYFTDDLTALLRPELRRTRARAGPARASRPPWAARAACWPACWS